MSKKVKITVHAQTSVYRSFELDIDEFDEEQIREDPDAWAEMMSEDRVALAFLDGDFIDPEIDIESVKIDGKEVSQ